VASYSYSCQNCCSSKSFSHFWYTRALVTAAQWSLVVSDSSITLFLKYTSLGKQICSVFDADPAFSCFQLDFQCTDLFVEALEQGCATFFVGGPYNQLQTSTWATRKI